MAVSRITSWAERMEMLVPPLPWDRPTYRENQGPLVILLHGLWRSRRAMDPLARSLHASGFATLNLPYPSTRLSIPQLVRQLRPVIERESGTRDTIWLTHSLGGILARALIVDGTPPPKRLAMLAPPNQGSEIVDHLGTSPMLSRFLGPAGRELGTHGTPSHLPLPPDFVETMIIMGRRSTIPFFRPLLAGDNDGIVTVERGKIPGCRRFHIVDADHTFIQVHPDTIRLCLDFFREPEITGNEAVC
jgi:triacylglycerol lipase